MGEGGVGMSEWKRVENKGVLVETPAWVLAVGCPDCGQLTCGYEAVRERGETLNLRLSSVVTPCFDLNSLVYFTEPNEWVQEECTWRIQDLEARGYVFSDTQVFYQEMLKASQAFWYHIHLEGDVDMSEQQLKGPEMTHEQKLAWEADVQTARAMMLDKDYLGVIKHVGGMYGLSEDEALTLPEGRSLKDHAERCMAIIPQQRSREQVPAGKPEEDLT